MRVIVSFPCPKGKKELREFNYACPIPLTKIKGIDPDAIKCSSVQTVDQMFIHAQKIPKRNFPHPQIEAFFKLLQKACRVSAGQLKIKTNTKISARMVINKIIRRFIKRTKKRKNQYKPAIIKKHRSRQVNWLRA